MNDTDITLSREQVKKTEEILLKARNAIRTVNPSLGRQIDGILYMLRGKLATEIDEITGHNDPDEPDSGEEAAQPTEPDTIVQTEGKKRPTLDEPEDENQEEDADQK